MNIDPMMLMPLLMNMNKKEDGGGGMPADMEKLMSMMSAFKSGNPADLLSSMSGGNEKMNAMMSLLSAMRGGGAPSPDAGLNPNEEDCGGTKTRAGDFAGDEITRALNILLKK